MTTQNTYDYLNRLTGTSSALSFSYQYNTAGQRTRVTQLIDGSYWLYVYDALGQLISAKKYFWDGTVYAGQQFGFTFDTIGNRTSAQAGGDSRGKGVRGNGSPMSGRYFAPGTPILEQKKLGGKHGNTHKLGLTPLTQASSIDGVVVWPSRDPIGENGGNNLYGFVRNNPISYSDRDGRITVRTFDVKPTINGSFDVKWNFILDSYPKSAGYIVQHVIWSQNMHFPNGQPYNGTFTPDYYELWAVDAICRFGHPPKLPKGESIYDYTDHAQSPSENDLVSDGNMKEQHGVIKFVLASNPNINISDFKENGVREAGGLKSTNKHQAWFDTTSPDDNEEVGERDVTVTWNWVNSLGRSTPNGVLTVLPPQ